MNPVNDKIIIKPHEFEKTTKAGIILPEINKEKFVKAEVMAVGDTVEGIEVGDTILYDKHASMASPEFEKGTFMIRLIDVIPPQIGNFLMNKNA